MIVFVLNLAGAVALLLWAVRMVRTSVERAFMPQLRAALKRAAESAPSALMGGAAAAILLQSSTAVAMLVAGFAGGGALAGGAGLTLLLGADLGSSIVARILMAPIGAAIPALLVLGVLLFLRSRDHRLRQTGRLLIGLALALIALGMIRAATEPLAGSRFVSLAVGYLGSDLISAFALGALLAWLMHSSVAAVLTFATFAFQGLLPTLPAAALVLGANLGGAAIAAILTLNAATEARRIITANLMLRGGGSAAALAAVATWPELTDVLGSDAGERAINLHMAFNLLLALIAAPLVRPALRIAALVLPDRPAAIPERLSALDVKALDNPDRALACANREVLRMAERLHGMLVPAMRLFEQWDADIASGIAAGEREVDRTHFEIKLYIARLQEQRLSPAQSRRAMDTASIANHLEDAGDQISTNLVAMARRMHDDGLSFSTDGRRDLLAFHEDVLENVRLALDVLMTTDAEKARQLVEEKDRIREVERRMQERHLARLRQGRPETLETSNLHQETLRALKQINTAFTLIAYPIAEEQGDLLSSRLAAPTRDA